ncbi:hypothetical protein Ahy_A03g015747 [Arachis hypogaea]|uniref:Cupin type-1 domain-containing protein n=1 Tax=Arachis hypogaea TaxID=3818 RepID=A0A445E1D3_ARAHY|nr:hypothetical protein Ahy_A03g015747 [Arachis hypogaea]
MNLSGIKLILHVSYILIHVSHLLNGNAVVAFRMISLGALYVTVRIHASVAVNIGENNINLMLKVPLLTPDLVKPSFHCCKVQTLCLGVELRDNDSDDCLCCLLLFLDSDDCNLPSLGSLAENLMRPDLPLVISLVAALDFLEICAGFMMIIGNFLPRGELEISSVTNVGLVCCLGVCSSELSLRPLSEGSPQALVSCYGGNWTLVLVKISGYGNAVAISGLSSQNPGVITVANAVFGSTPPISPEVLTKAFQVDKKVINYLEKQF